MTTELLHPDRLEAVRDYLRMHKFTHDESLLSETDISAFSQTSDWCVCLISPESAIQGIFCIPRKNLYRVRMFHAASGAAEDYRKMHRAMQELLRSENQDSFHAGLFIPDRLQETIAIWEALGCGTERYVYVCERPARPPTQQPELSPGFSIRPLCGQADLEVWANIRNSAFRNLKGFIEHAPAWFGEMLDEPGVLTDATLILEHGTTAIGIIKAERDDQPDGPSAFIGPVAVLPDWQGKGLGRQLLRTILQVIQQHYGWKSALCVNAENRDALRLYLQEGFELTDTVRAMKMPL
ncbi:MAG: GNAT family N-acetyltransferase [Spirochaetes bacterium]|nr:GNAT family N-acetyltransferase [Spirochaetota bacterium]